MLEGFISLTGNLLELAACIVIWGAFLMFAATVGMNVYGIIHEKFRK